MNVLEQQKGQKHRLSNKIAPQENHQKTQKNQKKTQQHPKESIPFFYGSKNKKKLLLYIAYPALYTYLNRRK